MLNSHSNPSSTSESSTAKKKTAENDFSLCQDLSCGKNPGLRVDLEMLRELGFGLELFPADDALERPQDGRDGVLGPGGRQNRE